MVQYGIFFAYWARNWNASPEELKDRVRRASESGFDLLEIHCDALLPWDSEDRAVLRRHADEHDLDLSFVTTLTSLMPTSPHRIRILVSAASTKRRRPSRLSTKWTGDTSAGSPTAPGIPRSGWHRRESGPERAIYRHLEGSREHRGGPRRTLYRGGREPVRAIHAQHRCRGPAVRRGCRQPQPADYARHVPHEHRGRRLR